jgi:type IX secretion system substrate protein/beta-propeller repeat-containing protein
MSRFIFTFLVLCIFFDIKPLWSLHKYNTAQLSSVTFIKNKGQWNADILYQSNSTAINVYFLENGLSFAEPGEEEEDSTGIETYSCLVWNMKFVNANPAMTISGDNENETKLSFLYGNDSSQWVIHPPEYSKLHYNNIYNNIDLIYYGDGDNLKSDYIVHPGGDLNSIIAYYEGVQQLAVNNNNELEITTPWDVQKQKAPLAWQEINGVKHFIDVHYVLINDTTFGFSAGINYDNNYDLIIDPLFEFVFSSFTKATGISNNINYCFGNATDAAGNVYLTGMVDGTYPTTPGAYNGPGSIVPEIFVSKFSKDGSTLIYSTYISGSSQEMGLGIAVDASGRAYIAGYGWSNFTGGNTYPTTANACQPNIYPSGNNAIFTVLNSAGTGLVYSTWLGGGNEEQAYSVAVDAAGMAYVTGYSTSSLATFSVKATTIPAPGGHDAFIAKFDISQSGANSLVYLVRMGGNGYCDGRSIAVNSSGNAFITGKYQQFSASPPFPATAGAYNSTYNSGSDNMMAFAAKLSSTLPVGFSYCTLLAAGIGNAIAVDPITNEAYIAGSTRTFAFPVTSGVLQPVHGQDALGNGNSDAFALKLNATGSSLTYCTFLGGEREDLGTGITINTAGEAYVAGTASPTFPVSPGAIQTNPGSSSGYDFFVVQLNVDASDYGCGGSTYVGGDDMDYGTMLYDYPSPKITISNHAGINDTVSVSGTSHSMNFPTTPGSYSPNKLNSIADQPVFFKVTCVVANPLAVEIISFSGMNDGNNNILHWSTTSEINNNYFTILKSNNGIDFDSIGTVKGASNSSQILNYAFTDIKAFTGVNYYQLKQTDYNGHNSFSKIIAVNNTSKNINSLGIYPNPAMDEINITGINFYAGDKIQIVNAFGKIVFQVNIKRLTSNLKLQISNLPNGIYLVKVIAENNFYSTKFIRE